MPGDEEHQEASGRVRTGPRHAAPRKPLLTRLHVPAGKAIAIAAMPSAVLMGMGLTPQLANAKPQPKNPFQDGPCVSAPDQEPEREKPAADTEPEPEKSPEPSAPSPKAPPNPEPEPEPDPEPEPGPSTPTPKNPLDPLGLGDAIKDLLTPDQDEPKPPTPTPAPTPTKPTEAAKDTAEKKLKEPKKALPSLADDTKDSGGKEPYPCPVEKKVAGDDERTPATLPNQPWFLEASSLTLRGLDYKGVVNVTMANGKTKQALKFTAESVDIGDLHQIVDGPKGLRYHVQAGKGTTSTIRGGTVTMYTERLQGNLFGIIPITFDPEHPPPVNTPYAYFTQVKITQAGQFGGNLTVPGLHQHMTNN
ncbi:hypothetical protein [Streptomyces gobiensis]|uniref:hypothetical protein n=1 Tax=Streptomyces gobiensis TaxID=2875706 RepID=UPI001E4D690E|nr:hypothetical protein [Streptomyces gobiensis]UGY93696.1 hypothetical protein test1122_19555 [Streptomyces gobiensis]